MKGEKDTMLDDYTFARLLSLAFSLKNSTNVRIVKGEFWEEQVSGIKEYDNCKGFQDDSFWWDRGKIAPQINANVRRVHPRRMDADKSWK